MNTLVADTKTDYAWEQDKYDNAGEYASALCETRNLLRFAAIWNPLSQTGYLARWSPTYKKWLALGGNFKNPILEMCADAAGNIYMVGDKGQSGNYVIKIYNPGGGAWSEADNGYQVPIKMICADSNGNVYIAGDFKNPAGLYYIERYTLAFKTWAAVSGVSSVNPILGLCIDSGNNLYALCGNDDGPRTIRYQVSGIWNTVTSSDLDGSEAICTDSAGNIYFNTTTTVMSYNINSKAFTDLKTTFPSYSGPAEFFLRYADDILYFAGYGYTGTVTTSAFVQVYTNSAWADITPPGIAGNTSAVIFDIDSYEGKSNNDILVSSDLNYLLVGKTLIH